MIHRHPSTHWLRLYYVASNFQFQITFFCFILQYAVNVLWFDSRFL